MTFLLVKKDHRAIRTDKREWYEFVCGEFLTVEEASVYNADLSKCRLVDVKKPDEMYWCFGVRLCDIDNYTIVSDDASDFDGQLYRYHYTVNIEEEVPFGDTPRFGFQMCFDRDDTLSSHQWKQIYAKAKWYLRYNDCPVQVTILRKSRHEVCTSGYSVIYCLCNWPGGTTQTWHDYTRLGCYQTCYHLRKKHGQKGNE
jgi:hypothetical protein